MRDLIVLLHRKTVEDNIANNVINGLVNLGLVKVDVHIPRVQERQRIEWAFCFVSTMKPPRTLKILTEQLGKCSVNWWELLDQCFETGKNLIKEWDHR